MAADSTPDHAQVVDAREIDGEPFGTIMAALDDLERDRTVLLINSFEPTPLYDVLEDRGFEYETTRASEDEWHVEISHRQESDSG
jgi:uncharacterized protein (DUF2249 family)